MESSAAIDQNVLGASFGDDHTAIDALWKNFQETAGEAEQEIDVASVHWGLHQVSGGCV